MANKLKDVLFVLTFLAYFVGFMNFGVMLFNLVTLGITWTFWMNLGAGVLCIGMGEFNRRAYLRG